MTDVTKTINDRELDGSGGNPYGNSPQILRGIVGWKDVNSHSAKGKESNDGHTLIRVTLNAGAHSSTKTEDGTPIGYQVLCQPLGPLYWIPPKGTHVLVAFPDGDFEAPGAGYILGSTGGTPLIQFGKKSPKMDFGPDQTLTIKAKQIVLSTYDDSHIAVGSSFGIMISNKEGSGFQMDGTKISLYSAFLGEANSILSMDTDKVSLVLKNHGFLNIENSKAVVHSNGHTSILGGMVFLGRPDSASPALPALIGLSGPAGIPSPSVFISAT